LQHYSTVVSPDQEVGQHAAFGRAKTGAAQIAFAKATDIIGKQVVEERQRIITLRLDQAEMSEGSDDSFGRNPLGIHTGIAGGFQIGIETHCN
jgi:hypothetical protein